VELRLDMLEFLIRNYIMNIVEARLILGLQSVSSIRQLCEVASAFEDATDEDITIPDILALLRAANVFDTGSSVKCYCALMLYRKANRPSPNKLDNLGMLVLDYDLSSWEFYLREHGFLK